jgi:hypothetical protein
LAFIPEYTPKATCALVAAASYSDLPEWEGFVRVQGLDPTEEQFKCGLSFADFSEDSADSLYDYDSGIAGKRLLPLMENSRDMETRVTLYLMRLRFPFEENEKFVDETLYARLLSGDLDKDEAHILRYSLLKWRDGRPEKSVLGEELLKDYIASLPSGPEDIESLFGLEQRSYRESGYGVNSDNIASSVRYGGMESWTESILTGEALEKLQAFLRYGKKYMHEADYGYLSDLAKRTEAIPERIQKTDQAGIFVFTGYPDRYSFRYSENGVESVSTMSDEPPSQEPDITIAYADGEIITVRSRCAYSTAYGGSMVFPELRDLDALTDTCKRIAVDSFFEAYHECDGGYIAYNMANPYGVATLFEVGYSPVAGAHLDAFLDILRTFQITAPASGIWHWLAPPGQAE